MSAVGIAALVLSLIALAFSGMSVHYARQARAARIEHTRLLQERTLLLRRLDDAR